MPCTQHLTKVVPKSGCWSMQTKMSEATPLQSLLFCRECNTFKFMAENQCMGMVQTSMPI